MRNYSFSTLAFRDEGPEAGLDAIAAAGFRCIELTGYGRGLSDWSFGAIDDQPPPPTGDGAAQLRRAIESRGLRVTSHHAPPRTHVLGAPTESWRTKSVAILGEHLRFTADMGAGATIIHGIPNPRFLPGDPSSAALSQNLVDAMRRSVEELIPVAERTGTRMLLENLPYTVEWEKPYPLVAMHQLRPFVEAFPPERVGLIVDTGHAWTGALEPVSEILTAGDRLWGTHLQDVPHEGPSDNHWVPTAGDLDWPAICAALDRIAYQGPWTFEVMRGREGETAHELARKSFEVAMSWGD